MNRKEKYSKNKIQRIQPLDFPLECGKLITRSVLTAFSENIVRLKISVQKEDIMAQLWGGRFTKETDKLVYNFNASISFDQKFYKQDIRGSKAHVWTVFLQM